MRFPSAPSSLPAKGSEGLIGPCEMETERGETVAYAVRSNDRRKVAAEDSVRIGRQELPDKPSNRSAGLADSAQLDLWVWAGLDRQSQPLQCSSPLGAPLRLSSASCRCRMCRQKIQTTPAAKQAHTNA